MVREERMNMDNIYEFGCETIQEQKNYVYESFEEVLKFCEGNGVADHELENREKNSAKITGAIVAEVFKKI